VQTDHVVGLSLQCGHRVKRGHRAGMVVGFGMENVIAGSNGAVSSPAGC
jgi:hypothetical protein